MVPALIAEILERIKTEEDPDTLNQYRALVRKHVPFFMRSYFTAYLYMQIDRAVPSRGATSGKGQGKKGDKAQASSRQTSSRQTSGRQAPSESRQPKADRPPKAERRPEEVRHTIPEDEAVSIFISAGRNRRAYGRDLLGLILNTTPVAKDDIGEIRVLDNFSFIQVRRSAADELIASLDGKEFRGRALAVSYAKPRKDDSQRSESSGSDSFESSESLAESDYSSDSSSDSEFPLDGDDVVESSDREEFTDGESEDKKD